MNADGGRCPDQTPLLDQRGDFGRKGRKGRHPAQEPGDDQETPFGRNAGVVGENGERYANQVAPRKIGGQGAWRNGGKLMRSARCRAASA